MSLIISTHFDFPERHRILLEHLEEYKSLTTSNPGLVKELSFDAYVQFSMAYHVGSNSVNAIEDVANRVEEVKRFAELILVALPEE
jgi:uncharacterized protein (DUF1697 family)